MAITALIANILDVDVDAEEAIALAGIQGFAPPVEISADRIPVDGTTLRFSDMVTADLAPLTHQFRRGQRPLGALVAVTGYNDGHLRRHHLRHRDYRAFARATTAEFSNPDAYVLTDGSGNRPLSRFAAALTERASARRSPQQKRAQSWKKPLRFFPAPAHRSAVRSTAGCRRRSAWSIPMARSLGLSVRPTGRFSAPMCRCKRRAPRRFSPNSRRRASNCSARPGDRGRLCHAGA